MIHSPVKIWRNQKFTRNLLGLSGSIVSWTKIHVPPLGFKSQAPYIVVVIELFHRKRATVQLVDWQEKHLKIGQKVITILRKTKDADDEGVIPYGIKCRPQ